MKPRRKPLGRELDDVLDKGLIKRKGLKETVDEILNKGIGIDAKIRAKLAEEDLLGLKALLLLSSLKTAKKIKLKLPEGVDPNAPGWKEDKSERCPQCKRGIDDSDDRCPWCGFEFIGKLDD